MNAIGSGAANAEWSPDIRHQASRQHPSAASLVKRQDTAMSLHPTGQGITPSSLWLLSNLGWHRGASSQWIKPQLEKGWSAILP